MATLFALVNARGSLSGEASNSWSTFTAVPVVFRKLIARRRTKLLLTLAVLLLVVAGPYVVSRLRSAGRQIRVHSKARPGSAEPVSTVRVLAYNIAHGRGATVGNWEGDLAEKRDRIDGIAALIAEADADVVILNEVDFDSTWSGHQNQAEAIARRAGFSHWTEQRNVDLRFIYGSWKFGNAILSRFPIVDAEIVQFPAHRAWEQLLAGCKQGVVCTLQLSEFQQVRVIAVHLEPRSEAVRAASARMIIDLAESSDAPCIAAGDFNSTPSDFPEAEHSAAGQNAMDVLQKREQFRLYAKNLPSQDEMTFSSTRPTRVIDWVLIPKGWRFADHRTASSKLSDHRPVIATVAIPIERSMDK